MCAAEARDQTRIDPVGLGAQQFTGSKRLDLRGVDDADPPAGFVQKQRQRLAIAARGLHAHVRSGAFLTLQPLQQLPKARRGVGEGALAVLPSVRSSAT